MATTGLHFGRSSAVPSDGTRTADHQSEEKLKTIDDGIEDGPIPWWSGFVWIPLLMFSLACLAGLAYAVVRVVF